VRARSDFTRVSIIDVFPSLRYSLIGYSPCWHLTFFMETKHWLTAFHPPWHVRTWSKELPLSRMSPLLLDGPWAQVGAGREDPLFPIFIFDMGYHLGRKCEPWQIKIRIFHFRWAASAAFHIPILPWRQAINFCQVGVTFRLSGDTDMEESEFILNNKFSWFSFPSSCPISSHYLRTWNNETDFHGHLPFTDSKIKCIPARWVWILEDTLAETGNGWFGE